MNHRNLTTDEIISQNIGKALDLTLEKHYCPHCLSQPLNRRRIIDKYLPLIIKRELENDVNEIHNAILDDNFLIDNFYLMEGKNVTVEIYSECWVDEEGTEVPPPFKSIDIYKKYLTEFWKTGVNCKIGRCGCRIDRDIHSVV